MHEYDKDLLSAVLRRDFASFIHKSFCTINPNTSYQHNWHIELIADYLESVRNGKIKRLIINMPPRALKSVCVSVAWPCWLLGHNPATRIMVASYAQMLSIKHSLDSKLIMNAPWYKKIFPRTILSRKHNQTSKFLTTENGFRFATSVGGSATGEGGDILIIDDPHNPNHIHSPKLRERAILWFDQTFVTRLNNKNTGSIILVMQRLHENDLSGYLSSQKNWELLTIPAIADEDINYNIASKSYRYHSGDLLNKERDVMEDLQLLESQIGIKNFAAQYLQKPLPANYSILSFDDMHFYEQFPEKFDYFIHSWDTAIKINEDADYSVGSVWGACKGRYYLVNLIRQKFTYPELKSMVERTCANYYPRDLLIEDKASGQALIQDLRLARYHNIVPILPKQDKITRFASIVPTIQAGYILFPTKAVYYKAMIEELLNFPNSKHDDIVDSVSQFVQFIKSQKEHISNINLRKL
jgi:predicted phage terminase large subunit-like protein